MCDATEARKGHDLDRFLQKESGAQVDDIPGMEGKSMRLGGTAFTCCTKGRHLKSMPTALCTLMAATVRRYVWLGSPDV